MRESSASASEAQERVVSHMGLLDLRHVQAGDLAGITRINHVGTILVTEEMRGGLAGIPMHHVGCILTVPADMKLKMLTGDIKLSGDFLEDGNADETLLVTGELTITSAFRQVGFRSVILTGEIFAPKGTERVLTPAISQLTGELFFYADEPRIFSGRDRFDAAFFSYLKRPISMFLRGEFKMEEDVTPELLQEKVSEIYLWGDILTSDSRLASCLLALTAVKYGEIRAIQP